jgi:hypothetical protein
MNKITIANGTENKVEKVLTESAKNNQVKFDLTDAEAMDQYGYDWVITMAIKGVSDKQIGYASNLLLNKIRVHLGSKPVETIVAAMDGITKTMDAAAIINKLKG